MSKFDKVYSNFFREAIFVNQNPSKGEPTVIDDANRLNSEEQLILKKWKMGDPVTREKWKVASWKSNVVQGIKSIKQPEIYHQPEFKFDTNDEPSDYSYKVYEDFDGSTGTAAASASTAKPKLKLAPRQPVPRTPTASSELPLGTEPGVAPAPSPSSDVPEIPTTPQAAPAKTSRLGQWVNNLPQNFADALAGMGGYHSRDKDLAVNIPSTNGLKKLILGNPDPVPENMDSDYLYYNLSDTTKKNEFINTIKNINPEAASRFNEKLVKLDQLKQNYITIKGTLPGSEILVGMIGNSIYAYYKA